MLGSFANLFRIPELRSRIFITFGLLIVYRIGWNIPLPGIDPVKIAKLMESNADKGGGVLDFLNVISGVSNV